MNTVQYNSFNNKKYTGCVNCCCRTCLRWILQLLLLVDIFFFIATFMEKIPDGIGKVFIYFLFRFIPVLYLIFVIKQLCSSEFKNLRKLISHKTFINEFKKLHTNKPYVHLQAESYHMVEVSGQDKDGSYYSYTRRDTTSDRYLNLYFNHSIDKSSAFILDSAKYVCLDLAVKIDLGDKSSSAFYKKERKEFYDKYYNRDICYNFEEHDEIEGKRGWYFIKTSGDPGVEICLFVIFTLFIPICEFYKSILRCRMKDQYYCMYKIVTNDTVLSDDREDKEEANNLTDIGKTSDNLIKQGKGIITFSDGNKFEGYFNNDFNDGIGLYNGKKYKGKWENNKYIPIKEIEKETQC